MVSLLLVTLPCEKNIVTTESLFGDASVQLTHPTYKMNAILSTPQLSWVHCVSMSLYYVRKVSLQVSLSVCVCV